MRFRGVQRAVDERLVYPGRLAAEPVWGAFLKEGKSPLAFVFGGEKAAEDASLEGECFIQGKARAAIDRFDGRGDRQRGHAGEELGQGLRPHTERLSVSGDDLVDETDAEGFGSVDHGAGEDHLEGSAGADQARQALGAAVARDKAELDLGLAEAGGGGGEAQGAGHGKFASAAEGKAVDAGDDGLSEGLNAAEDAVGTPGELLAIRGLDEFANVGAGGEGFAASAAQEDHADGVVEGESGEEFVELTHHDGVEGVKDRGAVEGNGGDAFVDGEQQGFESHLILRSGRLLLRRYNRKMIKGITLVTPVASVAALERYANLLGALGFEPGRGWDDGAGRGLAFLAPIGNLELMTGRVPAVPPVLIEVTQLDQVREAVEHWMIANYRAEEVAGLLTNASATHWGSRLFTVALEPGLVLGFWESEHPLHGKPIAVEGDLSAKGMRFAIVVARWNAVITDRLLQGALDGLYRSGAAKADVQIVRVPGAWEIPAAARAIAEAKTCDAIVTLGCLLRGETAHYEAIYTEVARGIGQSQQETGVPHAFGVLTCETLEQALDRAGVKAGNKGFEAAVAAIEMVSMNKKLRGARRKRAAKQEREFAVKN